MSENMDRWRGLDGSDGIIDRPFIKITFQHGAVPEVGVNGCRIEDVIELLQDRLLDHQARGLACEENAEALMYLDKAHDALVMRRRRREKEGVLNTPKRHSSRGIPAAAN